MSLPAPTAAELLRTARDSGVATLPEHEGMALLSSLGIPVPTHFIVPSPADIRQTLLNDLPGDRVVLKIISPEILHKTEVGGVAIVRKRLRDVRKAATEMVEHVAGRPLSGLLLVRHVAHERMLGRELLVNLRWTEDFGPVVTLAAGGIHANFYSRHLRPGREVAIVSPGISSDEAIERAIHSTAVGALLTEGQRGGEAFLSLPRMRDLLRKFMGLAEDYMPDLLGELEINPLVVTAGGFQALDVLVRPAKSAPRPTTAPRPLHKLAHLFAPKSVAVVGVSQRMNPGRIILRNLLRDGFDPDGITIVKPGADHIDGCRCVPNLESLPERVDLVVLAIAAAQVPDAMSAILSGERAESVIVIPGGLEETQSGAEAARTLRAELAASRKTDWGGPVVNGGNCIGIRSAPGRYDTIFLPPHKLPAPDIPPAPVAVVSQSGAFAVARASRLPSVRPRYTVSVGNQTDLTIGDHVAYLAEDPQVELFAVYVEGFAPMDGRKFLRAAAEITASGRTVLLYRAGRTAAGALASASHTASIAGDAVVTRELADGAGIVSAETLADFEMLLELFTLFHGKTPGGRRIAALTNAGFECVAIGDNLHTLEMAELSKDTCAQLAALLDATGVSGLVDIHNPLDLTPMTGDEAYAEATRILMADPQVDAGVISCVPLTPALNTLAAGEGHNEDVARADSAASRLVELARASEKPWVAVVDSGELFDPMARVLRAGGIPVFREADRATRLLSIWCEARLAGA